MRGYSLTREQYAERVLAAARAEIADSAHSERSTWRTYRVERLCVDESSTPPSIVALVGYPDVEETLGMRVPVEPEEGRDFMEPETWATIIVTNFEEALEGEDQAEGELKDGILWLSA